MTAEDVIRALSQLADRTLPVFITNGDLPDAPAVSVSVQAADYGQMVLIAGHS